MAAIAAANAWSIEVTPASSPASAALMSQAVAPAAQATDVKLRLTLTSGQRFTEKTARVAGLSICSQVSCIDVAAPSAVELSVTTEGRSTLIAEITLPPMEVSRIEFKPVPGPGVLRGRVVLKQPLKLSAEQFRGEVLVTAEKEGNGFAPASASATYWNPYGHVVSYNPAFPAEVVLPNGVKLTLPVGALAAPQLFYVSVHDAGKEYPLVDIYPQIRLNKPMRLEIAKLRPSNEEISKGAPTNRNSNSADRLMLEVDTTGLLRSERRSSNVSPSAVAPGIENGVDASAASGATANSTSYGWSDCVAMLSHPENQAIITNALATSGVVSLDWCSTIPPYVHIAVAAGSTPNRASMSLAHEAKISWQNVLRLPMMPLTSWSAQGKVLINGFTWIGGLGFSGLGDLGLPLGFAFDPPYSGIGTRILGNNLTVGGACDDWIYTNPGVCFSSSFADGNKRVMSWITAQPGVAQFIDVSIPTDGRLSTLIGLNRPYISSSTSILRDSVCTTFAETDRWSAIGHSPYQGWIVFLSAASGSTTSTSSLCGPFQALGVTNALRMDGGRSASMVVDGVLLNPLTGVDGAVVGPARMIPYGVAVGTTAPGVTPKPQPIIRVTIPPNPCVVNPRACA